MDIRLMDHHAHRKTKCINHNVFLAPHQFADHPMERVHQLLEYAFLLPLVEVVEDGVVGREVLGQHTPLAACLQYIHDGIHDVSKGVFSLSVLWVKNIFGNLPLFISKVGRILVQDSN